MNVIQDTDSSNYYVGLVVINPLGQVLLGKRREDGIWTGPGGGSEANETPESTAIREAFEEAQLELRTERLIPLDTLEAGNGKPIFCFLYIASPFETDTAVHLDPDKEVPKWEWYSQSEIPVDLSKDPNRHQAVINGLMTIKGLKKGKMQIAMQDHEKHEQYAADKMKEGIVAEVEKGGPGSGKRGHKTIQSENVKRIEAEHSINVKNIKGKIQALQSKVDKIDKVKDLTEKRDAARKQKEEATINIEASKVRIEKLKAKLNSFKKAKKVPIGTKHNGMEKVAEGKWVPITEGKTNPNPASDSDAAHQSAEAERHVSEGAKHSEIAAKLKEKIKHRKAIDPNYKVPAQAQTMLDEAESKIKGHSEDHKAKSKQSESANADVKETSKQEGMKTAKKKQSEKEKMAKLEESAQSKDDAKDAKATEGAQTYKTVLKDLKSMESKWLDKHPGKTTPPKARQLLKEVNTKIKDFQKELKLKVKDDKQAWKDKKVKKSIIGQYDNVDTAIGTTDYTIAAEAAKDGTILQEFKEVMANYNYGDAPRTIQLDRGYTIMMTKVDDGLYSGFVKQAIDWDGESELEENRVKIERQTIPEIIQYLKAKEYIYYDQSVARVEPDLEPGNLEVSHIEQSIGDADGLASSESTTPMTVSDNKIKFMELLAQMMDRI